MGTRGCVAWTTKDGWTGVYNHLDSYPTGLGAEIWAEIKKVGAGTLVKSLKKCGDWQEYLSSGICEYCGKKAGQPHSISVNSIDRDLAHKATRYPDPEAKHHEHGQGAKDQIKNDNCNPLFIEWVYLINLQKNTLSVMAHISDPWHKGGPMLDEPVVRPDGYTDYGGYAYKHILIKEFDLDGPEPDWEALDQAEIEQFVTIGKEV